MRCVMGKLSIAIVPWKLIRQVKVGLSVDKGRQGQLEICGIEEDGTPASILAAVQVSP